MPRTRVLSSRQWNHLCKSSFVGAGRRTQKECSSTGSSAVMSVLLSSSSVSTTSRRIHLNRPTTTATSTRRRAEEDAPSRLRAMGRLLLLPRTLSTTATTTSTWDAPPLDRDSHSEPQLRGNGTGNDSEDYTNLVARSTHLKEVAMGPVVDPTVRIEDFIEALEAWRDVASNQTPPPERLEAARHARSLLLALEHHWDHCPETGTSAVLFRPTVACYDAVLRAYTVCDGGEVDAMEAQELLERMLDNARVALQQLPPRPTPKYPEPTILSFSSVLFCWARAKCPDSGIRAEKVFSLMEKWRKDCQVALQRDPSFPYRGCYPTATTVSILINALNGLRAPDRAWQLLQEVVEVRRNPSLSEPRFRDVLLDPGLFNAVILSWTRIGRGRYAAAKAEEILTLAGTLQGEGLMVKGPCKRTYAMVLDAWSRSEDSAGDCAQRAHDLLFKLIRLYRQGAAIEFDAASFGSCIAAWSRCANLKDAPEKAEAVLQELLSLHEETGLADFQPDFEVWDTMLMVWLKATKHKHTESVIRCAKIIQRMQKHGCQPTIASYGKVLSAAAQRGLGDQALALLQLYGKSSKLPLLRDARALNSVLEALTREARDDSMDRATAFFEKMKFDSSYAEPNEYSYTILLNGLSRSRGLQYVERGRDLLEEMMQRFQQGDKAFRPDAHCMTVFLKLCARTNGTDDDRRRALDITLGIFRMCESYFGVMPNRFVYNAMLDAINRLATSDDQRLELLEEVFEECRARGHVSIATLTILRQGGASHCFSLVTASSCREVPHPEHPNIRRLLAKVELRSDVH